MNVKKGGSLPPDSTPKRCNTLYLAGQGVWKGVRTNRPYSFCCRAGVYLPPFSLHISFVFGGSKPPPYKVAVGKTCFMEDIHSSSLFLCISSLLCRKKTTLQKNQKSNLRIFHAFLPFLYLFIFLCIFLKQKKHARFSVLSLTENTQSNPSLTGEIHLWWMKSLSRWNPASQGCI